MSALDLFFRRLSLIVIFGSLCTFWHGGFFLFEINSNFGEYYFIAHLVCAAYLLARRLVGIKVAPRFTALLSIALAVHYGQFAAKFYFAPPFVAADAPYWRILFANVDIHNRDMSRLGAIIERDDPDVVGLAEVDQELIDQLKLAQRYPYIVERPRTGNFGLALYSKFQLTNTVDDWGPELPPTIMSELATAAGPIRLIVTHTYPPLTSEMVYLDRVLLRRISGIARHSEIPVVLAGDLNETPWSTLYRTFVFWNDFQDAMEGRGTAHTWSATGTWPGLMLDHILLRGVTARSATVLGPIGSDHRPVTAELAAVPKVLDTRPAPKISDK